MSLAFTRRHFFYGSLLAGAVPAGGFGSAPSLKKAGFRSPNEKLNIASIGAGGRAADDIRNCSSENIVALADPDSTRAAANFKLYEKIPKYGDFRKMLDKEEKNIDAVIVAIPDFMHGSAAMWCIERGKHVYVEKPLTRTIWEARQLKEAAARYNVVTQMGNQGTSGEGAREVCEIIWSGAIGNVTEVHAWTDRPINYWPQGAAASSLPKEEKVPETLDWDVWLGRQSMRPYSSAYLPFVWRGWKDFGCGALGDEAIHTFGAPNLALQLTAPTSVEVIQQTGKNRFTYPDSSVTRWEFPARGAMPPVKLYWYDASKGARFRPPGMAEGEMVVPTAPLTQSRTGLERGSGAGGNRPAGAGGGRASGSAAGRTPEQIAAAAAARAQRAQTEGCVFVGEKGYLAFGTDSATNVRLLPESRAKDYVLPPPILKRSPGHWMEWIMACKGWYDPPISNFNVSGPLTEWVLLGCIALEFEGKLEWDSNKMMFTNNKEANAYLKPTFRKGWSFT